LVLECWADPIDRKLFAIVYLCSSLLCVAHVEKKLEYLIGHGIGSCYLLDDRIRTGNGGHYDNVVAYAEKAVGSSVSLEFDCRHAGLAP